MTKLIKLLTIFSFLFGLTPAYAGFSPVALSIVPPVQFPGEEYDVTGFRLSLIYGKQRSVYGLDLGVIGNITTQDFVGVGVSGLFNQTQNSTTIIGLQAAGGWNKNTNRLHVFGLQAALGMNYNVAESTLAGVQIALVNLSEHTDIYGLQVGAYNIADNVYGFQIGLVNRCKNLHGVQIGIVNFHDEGLFKVSPILNVGF